MMRFLRNVAERLEVQSKDSTNLDALSAYLSKPCEKRSVSG